MSLEQKLITLQRKVEKISKMGEKTITKNYKTILDELRITIGRLYQEYEINGQLTFTEMSKYNRLQKLDKEVYDLITNLYINNSKIITSTLKNIVELGYGDTLRIVKSETNKRLRGIRKSIDVTKTINEEMAGLKWTERIGKHRIDAIYDIQKEVKFGLTQGDSYGTMSKRLKFSLGTDVGKANTIIRTESHRCFNTAKIDSLNIISKQGVKMTKTWRTSEDERVRSQHDDMNNITIPYEDYFILSDGVKTFAPGLSGAPQHDINCRCIIIIDIKE